MPSALCYPVISNQARDAHSVRLTRKLSLKLGEASEERSNAELSIILPGNGDSDIADQFHNFRTDSTASDKMLVIGQFSSAPQPDK